MEQPSLRFLQLLNTALAEQVQPAISGEMAGHIALLCTRLVNRILVTEGERPALYQKAIAEWRQQENALQSLLPEAVHFALMNALQAGDERATERALAEVMMHLARTGGTEAAQLAGALVDVDIQLRKAVESAYSRAEKALHSGEDQPASEGLTEPEQEALIEYIRQQIPGESEVEIAWQKQVPGGFSKQTIIFGLENNRALPDEVVVRRDGTYLPSGNSVTFEFPVIATLFESGVAVPQPFLLEASGDILPRPFMLLSKVEGKNFGDTLQVSGGSRALGLDLARRMAELHNVDPERFGDRLSGAAISTTERLRQEIEQDREKWDGLDTPSFVISGAFDWLLRNLDRADGARSLVHRDIGPHNMLVRDDRVMAILDWETPVIGNPAEDVGYSADIIRQMLDLEEFLQAYESVARHPIDRRQLAFYDLWASVRLTVLIGGARQGVLKGQLNDVKLAYVSEHYTARLMPRIASKLQALLAG